MTTSTVKATKVGRVATARKEWLPQENRVPAADKLGELASLRGVNGGLGNASVLFSAAGHSTGC